MIIQAIFSTTLVTLLIVYAHIGLIKTYCEVNFDLMWLKNMNKAVIKGIKPSSIRFCRKHYKFSIDDSLSIRINHGKSLPFIDESNFEKDIKEE